MKILENFKELVNIYFSIGNLNLYEKIKELDIELEIEKIFKTDFSQKVVHSLLKIKPGEVTTYSELGDMIGTRAYRAVGNVMRNNPIPLIIPCHRVIRKDGGLGGFAGQSGDSWETDLKENLLEIEGFTDLK